MLTSKIYLVLVDGAIYPLYVAHGTYYLTQPNGKVKRITDKKAWALIEKILKIT